MHQETTAVLNVLFGVDPQCGFCPKDEKIPGTGELPVPDGDAVMVPAMELFLCVYNDTEEKQRWSFALSGDAHPLKTRHFQEFGGKWPPHCIAGTPGSNFHPGIDLMTYAPHAIKMFQKGTSDADDGYSAADGFEILTEQKLEEVYCWFDGKRSNIVFYVWGLATDYCVKATVLDMLKLGYRVVLLVDAIRAVNVNPGDGERAINEMVAAGAIRKTTKEVRDGYRLS